ncbi:hypothetical protein ACRRTK_011729 [Alexandromys fortis]
MDEAETHLIFSRNHDFTCILLQACGQTQAAIGKGDVPGKFQKHAGKMLIRRSKLSGPFVL